MQLDRKVRYDEAILLLHDTMKREDPECTLEETKREYTRNPVKSWNTIHGRILEDDYYVRTLKNVFNSDGKSVKGTKIA